MKKNVTAAIERLDAILPLRTNQQSLSPELRQLHRDILSSYVEQGRSLNRAEISRRVDSIEEVIDAFTEKDMVVFAGNGEPMGAYPFTMQRRKHQVTVNGFLVHCMCALDSLAVGTMFDIETRIDSVCDVTSEAIHIKQRGMELLNAEELDDVFFGIDWGAADSNSCCADSLCMEMLFLKGRDIADRWLDEKPHQREIFTLDDALDFAAGFFNPLLQ